MHDTRKNGRSTRRLIWFSLILLLVGVGYSLGWLWLSGRIEKEAKRQIAFLQSRGMKVDCADMIVSGYPFQMRLYCSRLAAEEVGEGAPRLTAGALRAGSQIFDPARLLTEIEGPATFASSRFGAIKVNWSNLRSVVRLSLPQLKRVSLEGMDVRANAEDGAGIGTLKAFRAQAAPDGANLDLSVGFTDLMAGSAVARGRQLPTLSGAAHIAIKDGAELLGGKARSLRGQVGEILELTLSIGQGSGGVSLKGPFTIDQDGLIDANLTVTINELRDLSKALEVTFPENADKIRQGMNGLSFLGGKPALPLRITKGEAILSFIPLGKIPPIK